jgi:hypothetical protein
MATNDPTKDELSKCFEYVDGRLWRLRNLKRWREVDVHKANTSTGYSTVRFKASTLRTHRIIFILANGVIPAGYEIDHIDGNRCNNTLSNLRAVDRRGNQQNRNTHREGRLVGCHYHQNKEAWMAQITKDGGEKVFLGYYATEEEAHSAYETAEKTLRDDKTAVIGTESVKQRKTSGRLKGCSFHKHVKKWCANGYFGGKVKFLGYFDTELDAHEAYKIAMGID